MVREVKNLTNIKLTESDTDGIWLHFDGDGKACGISLDALCSRGQLASEAILAWAREQLDKQEVAHRRFLLHPPRIHFLPVKYGRPSPPVEGGY